jgi:hypothetical protein
MKVVRKNKKELFVLIAAILSLFLLGGTAQAAAPDAPADHNQYMDDGSTVIVQQGTTTERVVKIKATMTDGDGDNVQLQVEMRNNAEAYTGTPNCMSAFVSGAGAGTVATATCSSLGDGISFKWRARSYDGSEVSLWQDFDPLVLGDPDVTINAGTPLIHNSDNLNPASYGAWGVSGGKYGQFVCETCHVDSTTNIKRIRTSIDAPNATDTWPTDGAPSITTGPIVFTQADGTNSDMGDTAAVFNGICNVCHDNVNHVHYS